MRVLVDVAITARAVSVFEGATFTILREWWRKRNPDRERSEAVNLNS